MATINKLKLVFLIPLTMLLFSVVVPTGVGAATATDCGKTERLFGVIPTWYRYLNFGDNCEINITTKIVNDDGTVESNVDFKEIWLIGFGVIDMMLTLAGMIAVGFVISGGFQFVVAQGNPEKIVKARTTIYYALTGIVIAIVASAGVQFIVKLFQ